MSVAHVQTMRHTAVARDLERRIREREFSPGKRLPSERSLAREYGTTRPTIQTALSALARRGLLISRPSDGWFVQAGQHSLIVGAIQTFSQWAAANGREFGGRYVARDRGTATAYEAGLLGIRFGEQVLRSCRVRTLEGRPVMIERSTWAPGVLEVIEAFPQDVSSVYEALTAAGLDPVVADHRIEAVAASSDDARLLCIRRSAPLLQVSGASATRSGQLIEICIDRYISRFVAFDIRAKDVARALAAG